MVKTERQVYFDLSLFYKGRYHLLLLPKTNKTCIGI